MNGVYMRIFIILTIILVNSYGSHAMADNNPYYLKDDIRDVEFAVKDIVNRDTNKCDILLKQKNKQNKKFISAHFSCDFSNFPEDRIISWENQSLQKFSGLIKQQLATVSRLEVKDLKTTKVSLRLLATKLLKKKKLY